MNTPDVIETKCKVDTFTALYVFKKKRQIIKNITKSVPSGDIHNTVAL